MAINAMMWHNGDMSGETFFCVAINAMMWQNGGMSGEAIYQKCVAIKFVI